MLGFPRSSKVRFLCLEVVLFFGKFWHHLTSDNAGCAERIAITHLLHDFQAGSDLIGVTTLRHVEADQEVANAASIHVGAILRVDWLLFAVDDLRATLTLSTVSGDDPMPFRMFITIVFAVAIFDAQVFRLRFHPFEVKFDKAVNLLVDLGLSGLVAFRQINLASKTGASIGVVIDHFGFIQLGVAKE